MRFLVNAEYFWSEKNVNRGLTVLVQIVLKIADELVKYISLFTDQLIHQELNMICLLPKRCAFPWE